MISIPRVLNYFSGLLVDVDAPLDDLASYALVVAGDEKVCVLHARGVHGEPVDEAQRTRSLRMKYGQLRELMISVGTISVTFG